MILVCGEALIDLFVGSAAQDGALPVEAVAGGSPFNVALACARLGRPTAFLSSLSHDAFGAYLAKRLAAAGVSDAFLLRCAQRTTLSVVATDPEGRPTYSFYAEDGADRALAPDSLPTSLPVEVTAIAAGSYSLGVEPSATAIAALLRRETGRRAVSLDPNVRPLAVGDVGAFRLRFEELLACASIVKASEEDVQAFYGPADLGEVATDWLRRGPRLVVFTRGPTGPLAFTASGRIERPAPRVDVVDTVGAGDTFHGALLAALSMDGLLSPGMPDLDAARLVRALDFAAAAASLVCARRGADPPTLAEVAAFMPTGA